MRRMLNMVVMPQGGATKRPPTLYVANNKNQAGLNRPVRFVFSTVQAYVLEFSNLNVRIYANDGVVLSGGLPVDVVVPYTTADIPALKFCQSADTLFIFHQGYPPAKLGAQFAIPVGPMRCWCSATAPICRSTSRRDNAQPQRYQRRDHPDGLGGASVRGE
jgi:hypothetical protein